MLTGTVYAGERLFVKQAGHAVSVSHFFHGFHYKLVVVNRDIGGFVNGRQFMLCGSHFVVLGLGGNTKLPELDIQILHVRSDALADGAVVMILQLLTLGCGCAE